MGEHLKNTAELAAELHDRPELTAGPRVEHQAETSPDLSHQVESIHEAVEKAFEDAPVDSAVEGLQAVETAAHEPTTAAAPPSKYEKQLAAQRELKHVREKLKPADKLLSKAAHQKVVAATSEVAAQSITRPSGLLGGGIVAFIGSVGYLVLAKHLGFTYNSFVMSLLFIVGFALGLLMELIAHGLNHSSTAR